MTHITCKNWKCIFCIIFFFQFWKILYLTTRELIMRELRIKLSNRRTPSTLDLVHKRSTGFCENKWTGPRWEKVATLSRPTLNSLKVLNILNIFEKWFSHLLFFYFVFGLYAWCVVKMYHSHPQTIDSLLPGGILPVKLLVLQYDTSSFTGQMPPGSKLSLFYGWMWYIFYSHR